MPIELNKFLFECSFDVTIEISLTSNIFVFHYINCIAIKFSLFLKNVFIVYAVFQRHRTN